MSYKRSGRSQWVYTSRMLAGTFVVLGSTAFIAVAALTPWFLAFPASVFVATWFLAERASLATLTGEQRGIREVLERAGFAVDLDPSEERRQVVFAPVEHLAYELVLAGGSKGIRWLALHPDNILVFDFEALAGGRRTFANTPRTAIVFLHSDPALPRTTLGSQPWATLHRPTFDQRNHLRRQPHRIPIGDPVLEPKWIAFGHAQTVRAFLADGKVAAELSGAPAGESWVIGEGFVCCGFLGRLDADNLLRMYAHARRTLQ
ncbi:MAG: hypothetical protein JJT88_00135 [Gammaproteobacteria bacterium]|nr:hypothetical protein [Gammaproteobacteria bacterium]